MSLITSLATLANPLSIVGLVPVFAAGLMVYRYMAFDPESPPPEASQVIHFSCESYLFAYFRSQNIVWLLNTIKRRANCPSNIYFS